MIQTVKALLPRTLKKRIRVLLALPRYARGLVGSYVYDLRRYNRAASKGYAFVCAGNVRHTELRSWIIADTHKIEKALSLRSPRPGFGAAVAKRLIENLGEYVRAFGSDWCVETALEVLNDYQRYQTTCGLHDATIEEDVHTLAASCTTAGNGGGTQEIVREHILQQCRIPNIESFFSSRYSIRDFSSNPVDLSLIERAVAMAQKTPSVCNRQSWKAYVYMDEADKRRILELQLGNGGFGETAGAVLIVTADLATFFSFPERNQAWIDGGMFAMSLVYGLHAVGLGSCCLNWSAEPARDRKLMRLVGIPRNEVIIMLIAVGHLPAELKVAHSTRKPLDEVLVVGRIRE